MPGNCYIRVERYSGEEDIEKEVPRMSTINRNLIFLFFNISTLAWRYNRTNAMYYYYYYIIGRIIYYTVVSICKTRILYQMAGSYYNETVLKQN